MARRRSPFDPVSRRSTFALLGGAVALPLTALAYWQTGSEPSLIPVLFGGPLAGYFATRTTGSGRGVGVRVGLIGGLPVVRMAADVLSATSAPAGPPWFVEVGTGRYAPRAVSIRLERRPTPRPPNRPTRATPTHADADR